MDTDESAVEKRGGDDGGLIGGILETDDSTVEKRGILNHIGILDSGDSAVETEA